MSNVVPVVWPIAPMTQISNPMTSRASASSTIGQAMPARNARRKRSWPS
jgi:hypothetical protein